MRDENKPDLNVVEFKKPEAIETKDDLSADVVLTGALGKLKAVQIIGVTEEGDDLYFAMSQGNVAENLLLLETARLMFNEIMLGDFTED